jgi:hypothetical protein
MYEGVFGLDALIQAALESVSDDSDKIMKKEHGTRVNGKFAKRPKSSRVVKDVSQVCSIHDCLPSNLIDRFVMILRQQSGLSSRPPTTSVARPCS